MSKMFTRTLKRILDRVGSCLLLLAISPVLIAIAIAIFVIDGAPILFIQDRAGRDGVPFRMIKFRTMVRDAVRIGREQKIGGDDPFGIVKNDPRITRTGRFLRRTSLDELPQLINVARGQMSLVGPRPDLVEQAMHYSEADKGRLTVLPGITGYAQVNGRDEIEWPARIAMDIWYIEHWSLLLDVKIIARTLAAFGRDEPEPVLDTLNIARARAAAPDSQPTLHQPERPA